MTKYITADPGIQHAKANVTLGVYWHETSPENILKILSYRLVIRILNY